MSLKTLLTALLLSGTAVGAAYAQAGSGASAPVTPPPTASGPIARSPVAGDTSGHPRVVRRRPIVRPVPSNENGSTPDRAAAAGGSR